MKKVLTLTLFLFASLLLFAQTEGISYQAVIVGPDGQEIPGVDAQVEAAVVWDGKLIVGGLFDIAGSVAANRIAAWDGTSWSALGSGMNQSVNSLAVYDGKLIAGGLFTEILTNSPGLAETSSSSKVTLFTVVFVLALSALNLGQ